MGKSCSKNHNGKFENVNIPDWGGLALIRTTASVTNNSVLHNFGYNDFCSKAVYMVKVPRAALNVTQ